MKKIKYIDYSGKEIERECNTINHYKNYILISFKQEYNGKTINFCERIKYENVIKKRVKR